MSSRETPHVVRDTGREHGVLHVVHGLAVQSGGDLERPEQRHMSAVLVQIDTVAMDALFEHDRAAS